MRSRLPGRLIVILSVGSFVVPDGDATPRGTTGAAPAGAITGIEVEVGDWILVPVVADGGVTSFVAMLRPGLAIGDNVEVVWFRRQSDRWSADAWRYATPSSAIKHVAEIEGIDLARRGSDWPIDLDVAAVAVAPEPFGCGVFQDDPMAAVIGDVADPSSVVGVLVGTGWPAASIPIQLDVACGAGMYLDAWGEGVEHELSNGTAGAEAAGAHLALLGCIDLPCLPWTWTRGNVVLTGCTLVDPPGWTSTGVPSWNAIHCAVECGYTATVTCTYARLRVKRNSSCLFCMWTQTAAKTGTVSCTSTTYLVDDGCTGIPPGFTCPISPSCGVPQPIGPISGWGPTTPPCPGF